MEKEMALSKCRLCGTDLRSDLEECGGCWETYTHLQWLSIDVIIKLLKEANVDTEKLIEKLKEAK